ncbi:MAG TPA: OmpA family protein [Polyangium sp.]|nr:OmpA family protein [Polyangium sp.]
MRTRLMQRGALVAACAACLIAQNAGAQEASGFGALERFQPSVPGDGLFGVPSSSVGGHLIPRGRAVVDFNLRPLSIQSGDTRSEIVSQQTYLHLGASLPLFNRALVSFDMPFALAQSGDSPTVAGVAFPSPAGADVGDLRLGARVRLFGEDTGQFQAAAGAYFYVPTGPDGSYAADGAIRGEPHLIVGGRVKQFFYNVSLGTTLRASERPSAFDLRAGAAMVLKDGFVQVGPEFTLSAPFSKDILLQTATTKMYAASSVAAELLIGAKIRPLPFLVVGAGAGPGLTQGWGTPVFFAVGSVGYEPLPPAPKKPEPDSDGDGIFDKVDGCVNVRGIKHDNPHKNGCPADTDDDTILDTNDACPKVPGRASEDPKKNGCPPDQDGDGIVDEKDACPEVAGIENADPKKNGCPADEDVDSILDTDDACPKVAGIKQDDPKKNGCPSDRDNDGIFDAEDACPDQKGSSDEDKTKHGCPHVTVTQTEIVISRQVKFKFGESSLTHTVDPVSDDLLTEVRDAIIDHPEIEQIEVQGHTDNVGKDEVNRQLSYERAEAVRRWLVQKGIKPGKLAAKGYGSSKPIATNDTEEGKQQNRRVQFLIVPSEKDAKGAKDKKKLDKKPKKP